MFKQYLQVTKPGIIFGNLISVIGGFLLASKGRIDYPLFILSLIHTDAADERSSVDLGGRRIIKKKKKKKKKKQ